MMQHAPVTTPITDKLASMPWIRWFRQLVDRVEEIKGVADAPEWDSITGKPTKFPPSEHRHEWTDLDDVPTEFPPETHTHPPASLALNDLTDVDTTGQATGDVLVLESDSIWRPQAPAGGGVDTYASYSALASANPSSGFGYLSGYNLYQRVNSVWIPALDPANQANDYLARFTYLSNLTRMAADPSGAESQGIFSIPWRNGFCLVRNSGTYRISTSYDGGNVIAASASTIAKTFLCGTALASKKRLVAWSDAVEVHGGAYSDDDGATWNSIINNTATQIWDIAENASGSVVVAVGHLYYGFLYSSDGIAWSVATPTGTDRQFGSVAYDPVNDVFVAVAWYPNGSSATIAKSNSAGSAWTLITSPIGTTPIYQICWDPWWSRLVAVAYDGRTIYSTDGGSTWSIGGSTVGSPSAPGSMIWCPDLGGLVVKWSTGFYVSSDGGESWDLIGGNFLPGEWYKGMIYNETTRRLIRTRSGGVGIDWVGGW